MCRSRPRTQELCVWLAAAFSGYDQPERDRLSALVVDEPAARLTMFVREREFAFPQVAQIATVTA